MKTNILSFESGFTVLFAINGKISVSDIIDTHKSVLFLYHHIITSILFIRGLYKTTGKQAETKIDVCVQES